MLLLGDAAFHSPIYLNEETKAMRNKMYKTMSIMAVAGLLLTSCTSADAPKNGETPQAEEKVDLTGFPDLNPVKEITKFHQSIAYNAPNGTPRRASLTIQEFPNGGYVEKELRKAVNEANERADEGKRLSKSAIDKGIADDFKKFNDEIVYFATEFRVEKSASEPDGADRDRAFDATDSIFMLINKPCAQGADTSSNIPYQEGCLVSQHPAGLYNSEYRETDAQWVGEPQPFNYGDKRLGSSSVTGAGGGVSFNAKGADQDKIRNFMQAFAVYDFKDGGEPIASIPNFTCEPGSAGQAILDAFKAESDAEGGIAKRYMSFAPEGAGCTMQPVPKESADS